MIQKRSYKNMIFRPGALILLLSAAIGARGATILSLSGPIEGGFYGISPAQAAATSWSGSSAYTDVDISVLLGRGPAEGTAYLMTKIGPQTTPADEIARADFRFPSVTTQVTLFSELTLGPGTYYLVLGSMASSGQIGGMRDAFDCGSTCSFSPPTVLAETGVTRHPDYLAVSGSVAAYTPASAFQQGIGMRGDPFLEFTVSSDPVTIASVPEPGNLQVFVVLAAILSVSRLVRIGKRV
jgi:hypothetical protein